jgi:arylsulfatase A-like enzyme
MKTCRPNPPSSSSFSASPNKGLGDLNKVQQRNYLNFYGNLMKSSDRYLVRILEILASRSLLDNTLVIHTSDHGEMGMAHGGLRQKNFNFYEESLRVPLIYSNPKLYPNSFRVHKNNSNFAHDRGGKSGPLEIFLV